MAIMQDLSSHEKTTGQPTSAGRVIRAALMVSVALLILLGLTLYYRPFAVLDRVTRARLYAAGMQNQDVLIDGHRIHYLVGGTGKPIVLVHGLGSRASDWVGLIPPLVHGGHRIYAIDLLGYGQSDRPADAPYSIPQEARIVEDFLQAEHLQHVDLAGWSMGGWISMVVATDMPQRIDRLVLLDSAGLRFQPDFDPSLFTPTDLDQLHQLMHLLSPAAPAMPAFLARAFLKRARPDAWVIRRSVNAMLTGDDLLDNKLHEHPPRRGPRLEASAHRRLRSSRSRSLRRQDRPGHGVVSEWIRSPARNPSGRRVAAVAANQPLVPLGILGTVCRRWN
jgi:pimeloyl-ACP methyl ester carboxylesterase